jgi:hypothetical protein
LITDDRFNTVSNAASKTVLNAASKTASNAASDDGDGSVDRSIDSSRTSPVFWVLLAMAFMTFAPCVLVPVWQDYRALKVAADFERMETVRMRESVARQRRHFDALTADPLVAERLALRELSYRRTGDTAVMVGGVPPSQRRQVAVVHESDESLARIGRWIDQMPFSHRRDVFTNPATRATLMAMAGSLLVTAFVLYPPRRQ